MNKPLLLSTAALLSLPLFAADDAARIRDLEQKLESLEQKYRILERKIEISDEAAAEKAKTASSLSIGANGFQFRSADTNFVLKIRGLLQADARFFIDDETGIGGSENRNDRFLIRRARPIIEATLFKDIDFVMVPEFGNGSVNNTGTSTISSGTILDAYINYRLFPEAQVRVGKFKSPVGLEQLQSDSQAWFIERGLPSYLTPNRDIGFMLHGDVFEGLANYAVGVFNGVGDNANANNVDFDDEKEVAARVFFHPFQKTETEFLQGIGFGVGGSYGNQDGTSGLPAGNGFASETTTPFFLYDTTSATNAVTADGTHWRISPQGYWYYRQFGLMSEYVVSAQEVRRVGTGLNDELQHTAWQVVGGYVLTGEDATYRGVNPKKPFSISDGGWGALELTARYSTLDIDDASGPFAAAGSAGEARAYGVGLNWYANRNLRTTLNYIHTDFQNDNGTRAQQDENAIMSRVQLSF